MLQLVEGSSFLNLFQAMLLTHLEFLSTSLKLLKALPYWSAKFKAC